MLPVASQVEFTVAAELGIALLLGAGFGFALERAGFGGARKLTAVFYLHDMAVLKVMFTAIVTAMAGLFVFAALGWLDLSELYVEPTNLLAALVGGLVFGAGFVVGGYCPGTAVAASALGRVDAWLFALGLLAGVWTYAEFTPGIEGWIKDGQIGEVTLPSLTGIGMGWWVAVFGALLVGVGFGARWLERRFAHWKPAS